MRAVHWELHSIWPAWAFVFLCFKLRSESFLLQAVLTLDSQCTNRRT
jgi:hypothetical protein